MPYVNNNGVKIYYEVEGQGPPLILAHALMGSSEHWRKAGYVDALRTDFRLVLFDARGCGRTDKPREASAYDYHLLASDVVTILDELGIARTHYVGYSMGARVGFLLATRYPGRFLSFALGANTPYDIPENDVRLFQDYIDGYKLLRANPEAYVQRMERQYGRSLRPEERQRYLAQDADTLIAMHEAWLKSPSVTDRELSSISLPCLLYCGDKDQGEFHPELQKCVSHIPNARFVSLEGCDHLTGMTRSDLVLPHIKEFLATASRS